MKPKTAVKIDDSSSNKKVYFGDDGGVVDKPQVKPNNGNHEKLTESDEVSTPKLKKGFKKHQQNGESIEAKWYQVYEEHNTKEFKEIKDSELITLQQLCKSSFNDEIQKLSKSKLT